MPEGYALVREKIIVKGSLLCSERAYKCRTDGVECKVGWVWAKIKERLQQQWETSFTVTLSCWCAESLLPKQCPIHPPLVMYLLSCTLNHHSLQNGHWTCGQYDDTMKTLPCIALCSWDTHAQSRFGPNNPSPTFINSLCSPENLSVRYSLWFKQCPAFHLHLHLVSTFIWYQNQPTTLISTTTHQDHLSVIG